MIASAGSIAGVSLLSASIANLAQAAEPAVVIPPPAVDEAASGRWRIADSRSRRRLLLGRAGGLSSTPKASPRQCPAIPAARRRRRITRWSAPDAPVTPSRFRSLSIPKQISLRKDPADLFLGGAQSDRAELPGARQRHVSIARRSSMPMTSRSGSPRPISPSSIKAHVFSAPIVTKLEPLRVFIRPRTITRILPCCTRATLTSSSTTCRRSTT